MAARWCRRRQERRRRQQQLTSSIRSRRSCRALFSHDRMTPLPTKLFSAGRGGGEAVRPRRGPPGPSWPPPQRRAAPDIMPRVAMVLLALAAGASKHERG